jgi:hypothetical protein
LNTSHSCNNVTSANPQLRIPTPSTTAIADTGCTGHFLEVQSPCTHRQSTTNGIHIQLPNNIRIQATHTCLSDIPSLPPSARQAHIFSQLAHALISIGLLCDHGCLAIFHSRKVEIWYQNPKLRYPPWALRSPHQSLDAAAASIQRSPTCTAIQPNASGPQRTS